MDKSAILKLFSVILFLVLLALYLISCGGGGSEGREVNRAPTASLIANPDSGVAPVTVTFDATGCSDPDSDTLTFDWDFGDGSTQSGGTVVSHTYIIAGSYTATVTVSDGRGGMNSDSVTIMITAPNQPPIATFTSSPTSGTAPLRVTFDASSSSDPDGYITSYSWTFGDGSTGSGVIANHTYTSGGTYTATLTVIDDDGKPTTSAEATIVVNPPPPPGPWKFVSIPDHLNADIGDVSGLATWDGGSNSTNTWHENAIDFVLDAVAAEDPDFVLVAGDLVNGHWDRDVDGREIFGPVDTRANRALAINNAADVYYSAWKDRFAARGLVWHAAVGDHEIGDNNWSAGSNKSHLVPVWKTAFARHFTLDAQGDNIYDERPVGTPYEDTAYAFVRKNMLVVTVDVWYQEDPNVRIAGTGSVTSAVNGGQLTWLENVLTDAKSNYTIDHIIVQGHTPVLAPVRSQSSSVLTMPGHENTQFWQTMVDHEVDLYLAGEVHHMTASNWEGVEQVAHGGIMGYAPNMNYLVVTVYEDKMELELKWIDMTYYTNTTLWQAGSNRPREAYTVDEGTGFRTAGTLTIDKSLGTTEYKNRTGFFEWYGTFPP
jgi:PKD repeat protein